MAEGPGFEPGTPISQGNRLAGGRTRPLCDPSIGALQPQVFIVLHLRVKILLLPRKNPKQHF